MYLNENNCSLTHSLRRKQHNILTCYLQFNSISKHNFPTCCQGTVVGPSIRGVYIVLGESVDTALWSRRRPRTILTFTTPVSIHVNGSRVRWSWSEPVHTGFPLALVTVVRPLGGNRALESHRVSQLSWCRHRLLDHSLGDKPMIVI